MKKKISFLFILLLVVISANSLIYGVNFTATASKTTVEIGETVTFKGGTNNAAGKLLITSSNPNVFSVAQFSNQFVDNSTITTTGTAKSAGTAVITISGILSGYDEMVDKNVSKTITITVKEKPAPPVVEPDPKPQPPTNNNNGQTTPVKSPENYLKSLNVNREGLKPNFSKYINDYTLTVGSDVDKLDLGYSVAHSKAKVTVTGNSNFVIGNNTVTITVTAENGYRRVYKILVTKAEEPKKADAFLKSLIIENVKLDGDFQSEKLEYNLQDQSVKKLNILAYPRIEGAKVEILGNDTLLDGKNVVTIKVTAVDNVTVKEYKLIFNNTLPKEDVNEDLNIYIYDELKNTTNNDKDTVNGDNFKTWFDKNGLYTLLLLVIILEFIQIVYLYNKKNNNNNNPDGTDDRNETNETNSIIKNDEISKKNIEPNNFEDLKPSDELLKKIIKEKNDIANATEEDLENETLESILKKRRNKNL